MLPICFKNTKQNKTAKEKEKSVTQWDSNPRPLTCEGNVLSIAQRLPLLIFCQINWMLFRAGRASFVKN